MYVNESELELLESDLDQALEAGESLALRQRLETETVLRGTLEELRAQREGRRAYFAAMEPAPAELARFLSRVNDALREAEMPEEKPVKRLMPAWLGWMKYAVAAAACMGLGVLIRPMVDSGSTAPTKLAVDQKTGRTVNVRPVSMFEVTLRDQAGAVVAVQRFESIEKAQEFAGDLSRWQSRSERLAAGQFVVTADRF